VPAACRLQTMASPAPPSSAATASTGWRRARYGIAGSPASTLPAIHGRPLFTGSPQESPK
jgi:hypothetical protein